MHRSLRLLVGTLLVLLPVSASASTLTINSSTLGLAIGALPAISIPGNLSSLAVSSGAGTFTEPALAFGPATVPLPVSLFTGVPQISGLTLTNFGNGTKVCTGTGPLTCIGGLAGASLVNILQLFNLTIPLSVVGVPGASTVAGSAGITITVIGQGWTATTALVTGVTATTPGTAVVNTATSPGSDNRTAGHGGTLKLVTGFQAITNVAGTLPGFAIQTFSFAPEPAGLLGFASAAGAVAVFAHRRLRRK